MPSRSSGCVALFPTLDAGFDAFEDRALPDPVIVAEYQLGDRHQQLSRLREGTLMMPPSDVLDQIDRHSGHNMQARVARRQG